MPGYQRAKGFHGHPVVKFIPGSRRVRRAAARGGSAADPQGPAWHLSAAISGPPDFDEVFERFVHDVDTTQVTAPVVGSRASTARPPPHT